MPAVPLLHVCVTPAHTQAETLYKGHLLESETYIGGKVEALESGVFRSGLAWLCPLLLLHLFAAYSISFLTRSLCSDCRSDLPTRFKCKPEAYQGLIDCLDRDLTYALQTEARWELGDVSNYEEVKAEITQMLEALRKAPNRCGHVPPAVVFVLPSCVVLPLLRCAGCVRVAGTRVVCREWHCGCCGGCAAGRRSL